ncbi:MAG: cytochrome c3 family protein [Planctomycetes bacterium]|nr:cytochrome c3 family protein [Planctomycetota bacterium]
MSPLIFPEWTNKLRGLLGPALLLGPVYLVVLFAYGASPETTDVGYQPTQPIPFSHAQHAGQLKLDCRYCHNSVEREEHAAVPPAATCLNCHATIKKDSEKLATLRDSVASGQPIPWRRVHDLPDYVYFNHAAHLDAGVGCVSCHDRVDQMDVVYQAQALSMGWCLDCHRNPEKHLRPKDRITDMAWKPEEDQESLGRRLRETQGINPSQDCSTCHR